MPSVPPVLELPLEDDVLALDDDALEPVLPLDDEALELDDELVVDVDEPEPSVVAPLLELVVDELVEPVAVPPVVLPELLDDSLPLQLTRNAAAAKAATSVFITAPMLTDEVHVTSSMRAATLRHPVVETYEPGAWSTECERSSR